MAHAWERAREAGSYRFISTAEQNLVPRAIPEMIGQRNTMLTWQMDGALMLPDLSGLAGLSAYLLVGSTTLGLVAGLLTWVIAFGVMRRRRQRQRPARDAGESQPAA